MYVVYKCTMKKKTKMPDEACANGLKQHDIPQEHLLNADLLPNAYHF